MKRQIIQIQRHRNGVCGDPFHAVLFYDTDGEKFLATVFDREKDALPVAVLSVERMNDPKTGVLFGINSWRGDHYSDWLYEQISHWERHGRPNWGACTCHRQKLKPETKP